MQNDVPRTERRDASSEPALYQPPPAVGLQKPKSDEACEQFFGGLDLVPIRLVQHGLHHQQHRTETTGLGSGPPQGCAGSRKPSLPNAQSATAVE